MKRTLLLTAILTSLTCAGTLIPANVIPLTQHSSLDSTKGLVALIRDTGDFRVDVRIDLVRLEDSTRYRLWITPPRSAGQRKLSPELILQPLPTGRYTAIHLILGDEQSEFTSDTQEIRAGRVTSWGRVRVLPVKNMFGLIKELRIETVSDPALTELKDVSLKSVRYLPVDAHPLHWKKSAEEASPLQRITP